MHLMRHRFGILLLVRDMVYLAVGFLFCCNHNICFVPFLSLLYEYPTASFFEGTARCI